MTVVTAVVLTALVIAAVWNTASRNAYQRAEAETAAEQYAENAEKRIERECGSRDPVSVAQCVSEIINATREDQRAERDVQAQASMNRWSFWMLWTSVASVIVTGVGVVYVALTLNEARKTTRAAVESNTAAQKGADAARQTATDAREIGEKQVKAYLHVETIEAVFPSENRRFMITTYVKNTGQSPAINLSLAYRVAFHCGGYEIMRTPENGGTEFGNFPGTSAEWLTASGSYDLDGAIRERKVADIVLVSVTVFLRAQDVFGGDIEERFFFGRHGEVDGKPNFAFRRIKDPLEGEERDNG